MLQRPRSEATRPASDGLSPMPGLRQETPGRLGHHQAGVSPACHRGAHAGTLPHEDHKDQKAVTMGASRAATCYLKINQ